jgi:hypothetical protein
VAAGEDIIPLEVDRPMRDRETMHEPLDDTDPLRDSAAFDGYSLGLKVFAHALAAMPPGGPPLDFWEILRDIAGGRLTLYHGASEMVLNHPSFTASYGANLNQLISRERDVARHILATWALVGGE